MSRSLTAALSIVTGVALELGVALRSHRREAWDSEEFWIVGLPCALAASLAIGWAARDRDWRWTAAVVPAQVVTMMARNGDLGFNLWPLTVALSAILSAPFLGAAFIGARLRARRRTPAPAAL
jgi:hypothetical protein